MTYAGFPSSLGLKVGGWSYSNFLVSAVHLLLHFPRGGVRARMVVGERLMLPQGATCVYIRATRSEVASVPSVQLCLNPDGGIHASRAFFNPEIRKCPKSTTPKQMLKTMEQKGSTCKRQFRSSFLMIYTYDIYRCIYIYAYTCICIYTYIICMCIYIYIFMCVCVCVCVLTCWVATDSCCYTFGITPTAHRSPSQLPESRERLKTDVQPPSLQRLQHLIIT